MTVIEYLGKLPGTKEFNGLDATEKDQWIFQATELLKDHLNDRQITTRIIAIQTLFMYEGESEDFAMLRRQGVESFNAEGLSITMQKANISPIVIDIVNNKSVGVGSMI